MASPFFICYSAILGKEKNILERFPNTGTLIIFGKRLVCESNCQKHASGILEKASRLWTAIKVLVPRGGEKWLAKYEWNQKRVSKC